MPKKKNSKLRNDGPKTVKRKYVKKKVKVEEKYVDIFVSPALNLNGTEYSGYVNVPELIANQLRYMMEQLNNINTHITVFKEHKTIDLGSV